MTELSYFYWPPVTCSDLQGHSQGSIILFGINKSVPTIFFLDTVVEARYEISRILSFFGLKWSKMMPMEILQLVMCNFYMGILL